MSDMPYTYRPSRLIRLLLLPGALVLLAFSSWLVLGRADASLSSLYCPEILPIQYYDLILC